MDRKTRNKALHPRDDVDKLYVSRKKKVEEGLPAVKIVPMHRYEDSKIKLNNAEEYWLQRPETIQTAPAATEKK